MVEIQIKWHHGVEFSFHGVFTQNLGLEVLNSTKSSQIARVKTTCFPSFQHYKHAEGLATSRKARTKYTWTLNPSPL